MKCRSAQKVRDQNLYFIIFIRLKVKYSVVSFVSICVKFPQDISATLNSSFLRRRIFRSTPCNVGIREKREIGRYNLTFFHC